MNSKLVAKDVLGHMHDPFNVVGCSTCHKNDRDEQNVEKKIEFECNRILDPMKSYKAAKLYFRNNHYKLAKNRFIRALLYLLKDGHHHRKTCNFDKCNHFIYIQRCIYIVLLFCYKCNDKLNRYEYCMRDLNEIISSCKYCIPKYESHTYVIIPRHLESILKKAVIYRAKLFEKMGNSAHALSDYMFLKSCASRLYSQRATKLSFLKHPDQHLMVECNTNTKQMVKFTPNNGWKKINAMHQSNMLPAKFGHTMFEFGDKLYVFGGNTCYGTRIINIHQFLEIDLNLNTNVYTFRNIKIPNEYIDILLDMKHSNNTDEAMPLKIVKWKHFLITFGGNNYPFMNSVRYNLNEKRWGNTKFISNAVPKVLKKTKEIRFYSIAVMYDKIYCFGLLSVAKCNALCCFDLKLNKWTVLSTNVVNPHERFSHFMFVDPIECCVYIGFGHYLCSCGQYDLSHPQRNDVWQFDVKMKKWWEINILNGNAPVARAESAYCVNYKKNNFYLFGGNMSNGSYSYLGDFFEFNLKSKKWKLIQSKIHPSHRAKAAICIYKNFIVLYGGYHSLKSDQIQNDVWVINMKEMKCASRNQTIKCCQNCGVNSAEKLLWKCSGKCGNTSNVARYCSLSCQKRHWKYYHRHTCSKY
eukprot:316789_1